MLRAEWKRKLSCADEAARLVEFDSVLDQKIHNLGRAFWCALDYLRKHFQAFALHQNRLPLPNALHLLKL